MGIPECDVQLFGPWGEILTPALPADGTLSSSCRVFIDVAPQFRIAVHALYVDQRIGTNQTGFSYISVSAEESFLDLKRKCGGEKFYLSSLSLFCPPHLGSIPKATWEL